MTDRPVTLLRVDASPDAIVVGAGIVGSAIALELALLYGRSRTA
jgi:choline dehydrogenase-like flavoprotein